jgi:hypothetical protein
VDTTGTTNAASYSVDDLNEAFALLAAHRAQFGSASKNE